MELKFFNQKESVIKMNSDRFSAGMKKYDEIFGDSASDNVAQLGDLGKYVAEFSYGDVYSRPGLGLREREIAAIAMLASRSGVEGMLRIHIKGGLRVGLTYQEIKEIIIQTALFSGFATAIQSLQILQEFQDNRG